MKYKTKISIITLICSAAVVAIWYGIFSLPAFNVQVKDIKVGFIYIGDGCNAYTHNFMRAQDAIEVEYGEHVEIIPKYNVAEGSEEKPLQELVDEGCDLIFATSYGFGEKTKEFAEKYPDIEFCMATCSDANEEPKLENYHNFMGKIYEGRYISGVVAGMKLREIIDSGEITKEQAKIGYVAAFPYAEVISGYTAFFLGIRSIVPEATMSVRYTNSWGDYDIEKKMTKKFIEEGCVIISQHSDTLGPAVACEEMSSRYNVYHIGYNQSMSDVAPTTSLISSRINWQYYMLSATEAVMTDKKIESNIKGKINGNDASAGFDEDWVGMLKLNDTIAAEGTQKKINELIEKFKNNKISVFKGDYKGVDPFDSSDTIDLNEEYHENAESSAPTFHYVLKDVITIIE